MANLSELIRRFPLRNSCVGMCVVRVLLGIFFFYKGALFLLHPEIIGGVIRPLISTNLNFSDYVGWTHLLGGAFIMFGFLTRYFVIVQLAILACAVSINFVGKMDVFAVVQSSVSLALCVIFIEYGSGRYSLDQKLKTVVA